MAVLIPDLPAHGASEGVETDAPAAARAVAALMAARGFTPDYMIGHSFGGGVAGMLASTGVVPRRVVAIASPSRLRLVTDDFAEAFGMSPICKRRFEALVEEGSGVAMDDLDGHKIWPSKLTKMLILHAPDDEEVVFTEAERLAEMPNARLLSMPGLGHRRIVHDEKSVSAAVEFLTSD